MKRQIPASAVVAVGLLIVAAVAYWVLIRPTRAESGRLDEEIAQLESKVATARLAARPGATKPTIRIADLFQLAKAMPDKDDMAGIVLELNAVAESAGIRFLKMEPKVAVPKDNYSVVPILLTFEGSYYDLTDVVFRLRNLVNVRDGRLSASGRLYTFDGLDMHQGAGGFPTVEAVLSVSAYVFGAPAVVPAPVPAPAADPAADPSAEAAGGTP